MKSPSSNTPVAPSGPSARPLEAGDGRRFGLHSSDGVYIPIAAGILVALIVLLGLAIDSGNLFAAQLRLQRSLDAATIGAARLVRAGVSPADAEARGKELFAVNMAQMGYPGTMIPNPAVLVTGSDVSSWTQFDPSLLVLQHFLAGGPTRTVASAAHAQVSKLVVSILGDVSGSMNCAPSGPCVCNNAPGCTFPTRMSRVQEAANSIAGQLRPDEDSVALISFNYRANLLLPVDPAGGFDRAAYASAAGGFVARGGTNTQEAIEMGVEQILRAPSSGSDYRAIILVTDGAPNAVRVRLMDDAVDALPPNQTARTKYDYYLWAVAGSRLLHDFNTPPGTYRPSLVNSAFLVPAPLAGPIPQPDLANTDTLIRDYATFPACGEVISRSGMNYTLSGSPGLCYWTTGLLPTLPDLDTWPDCGFVHLAAGLGRRCLSQYHLARPDDAAGEAGAALALDPDGLRHTYQLFMRAAVAEADHARRNNIAVYVIGIGSPAPEAADPYQNVFDAGYPKAYWLRRIANDPAGHSDPAFPGLPGYGDLPQGLEGKYVNVTDATQVTEAMHQIVSRIKYRLTE